MTWENIHLTGWAHFEQLVGRVLSVSEAFGTPAVFRGQSDSAHSLEPSLLRSFRAGSRDPHKMLDCEQRLGSTFGSRAHLHLTGESAKLLEEGFDRWALMQHHGSPTRLLDWTRSPYVAAYFACADQPEKDATIWCFRVNSLNTRKLRSDVRNGLVVDEKLGRRFFVPPSKAKPAVLLLELTVQTDRIVAQQGAFTVCTDVTADHAVAIPKCLEPSGIGQDCWRLTVSRADKLTFLRHLRAMNVWPAALFPGLDGVGREMGQLAKLAAAG